MMRRLLTTTVAATALLGGAVTAQAATGTLTGLLPKSTGPLAKKLPAGMVATPLFKGTSTAAQTVGRNRRFTLKLTPGLWLLTSTTWGPKGAVEKGELVQVKAGRRRAIAMQTTSTAVNMSVGKIMDPTGTWDVSSLVDVEMGEAADDAPCDYIVSVDRKGRGYQEVLKELKLNTTKYFPPQVRAQAKKALASLAGTAPQYRVEGRFTALGEQQRGATSGEFRLVDTKTGQVIWKETISTADGGHQDVMKRLANSVSKAICGAPVAFAGNIKSTVTVSGADSTWTANLAAVFLLDDGGDRGSFYELSYTIASLSGSVVFHATDGQGCVLDAAYNGSTFGVSNGTVILRVYADGHRTYHLNGGIVTAPVTGTAVCPDATASITIPLATGYLSAENAPWTGPILAGSYSGPWNNPIAGFGGQSGFQMNASWELVGQTDTPE
ncbi:MAG: hypothetical protein IT200_11155 [Thermoleophilia bacterium]|nr:hypothetical protein [Thermoleophilia bacterium]